MKKRWLLRLGLLAGLALVSLWFVLSFTTPNHRITQSSMNRIHKGMTRQEVVAVIGVEPGNFASDQSRLPSNWRFHYQGTGLIREDWIGDNAGLIVLFGADDTLVEKHYESFDYFDKLRGLLGLQ